MSVTATGLLSVCVTSHRSRSHHFPDQTTPVRLTGEVFCLIDAMDCQVAANCPSGMSQVTININVTSSQQKKKKQKKALVGQGALFVSRCYFQGELYLVNVTISHEKIKSRVKKCTFLRSIEGGIRCCCHKTRGQSCVARSSLAAAEADGGELNTSRPCGTK